jgi:hypothetical protein
MRCKAPEGVALQSSLVQRYCQSVAINCAWLTVERLLFARPEGQNAEEHLGCQPLVRFLMRCYEDEGGAGQSFRSRTQMRRNFNAGCSIQ